MRYLNQLLHLFSLDMNDKCATETNLNLIFKYQEKLLRTLVHNRRRYSHPQRLISVRPTLGSGVSG